RRSGRLLWSFEAGQRTYPPDRRLGIFASPAVERSTVHLASDRLIALSLESGSLLWERAIGSPETTLEYFWAAPLVHQGRLYAGVSAGSETRTRGRLVCVDAESGRLRWSFATVPEEIAGGALIAPPALDIATRTLYAATGNPFHATGRLHAPADHGDKTCLVAGIEAATGELRWLHSLPAFQFGPLSVAGGVVFIGLIDGKLRAWRSRDGEPVWESPPGSPIDGGPAIARGMVFVGSGAGEFLPGNRLRAFALPA